jgi:hypothetical protein
MLNIGRLYFGCQYYLGNSWRAGWMAGRPSGRPYAPISCESYVELRMGISVLIAYAEQRAVAAQEQVPIRNCRGGDDPLPEVVRCDDIALASFA